MRTKTFCLGIAGIVAVLAVSAAAVVWCLPEERYMDREYPGWMQQRDAARAEGTEPEAVILGDSRVKIGAWPKFLAEDVQNLALTGGTPLEMYYTLQDYLAHHPNPRMVLVVFAPVHYTRMDSYLGRTAYFHYLEEDRLRSANREILQRDGVDYQGECDGYIRRLPPLYMKPALKSLFAPRTEENRRLYEEAAEDHGHIGAGWTTVTTAPVVPEETESRHFRPLPSQTYYMEQMIELCQTRGIPLHIGQAPMGAAGLQKLEASGYLSEYRAYMDSFSDRYHVDVDPNIPAYEDRFFADRSHLNEEGQKRYSAALKQMYFDGGGRAR